MSSRARHVTIASVSAFHTLWRWSRKSVSTWKLTYALSPRDASAVRMKTELLRMKKPYTTGGGRRYRIMVAGLGLLTRLVVEAAEEKSPSRSLADEESRPVTESPGCASSSSSIAGIAANGRRRLGAAPEWSAAVGASGARASSSSAELSLLRCCRRRPGSGQCAHASLQERGDIALEHLGVDDLGDDVGHDAQVAVAAVLGGPRQEPVQPVLDHARHAVV
ncbi:hypothetical protein BM221_009567 [Beauveria bassiana]|uniref:Uncharacterized protein n=1 Tax=Beauveria bassiana TaxID=176275 RepID=A0A2N6NBU4_BEABA|nr:hypothetical protein BM221_009567 [Beauveria bassiana]